MLACSCKKLKLFLLLIVFLHDSLASQKRGEIIRVMNKLMPELDADEESPYSDNELSDFEETTGISSKFFEKCGFDLASLAGYQVVYQSPATPGQSNPDVPRLSTHSLPIDLVGCDDEQDDGLLCGLPLGDVATLFRPRPRSSEVSFEQVTTSAFRHFKQLQDRLDRSMNELNLHEVREYESRQRPTKPFSKYAIKDIWPLNPKGTIVSRCSHKGEQFSVEHRTGPLRSVYCLGLRASAVIVEKKSSAMNSHDTRRMITTSTMLFVSYRGSVDSVDMAADVKLWSDSVWQDLMKTGVLQNLLGKLPPLRPLFDWLALRGNGGSAVRHIESLLWLVDKLSYVGLSKTFFDIIMARLQDNSLSKVAAEYRRDAVLFYQDALGKCRHPETGRNKCDRIIFTGHSLGGAMASYALVHYLASYEHLRGKNVPFYHADRGLTIIPRIIPKASGLVFGAPGVRSILDNELLQHQAKHGLPKLFNFIHPLDIVPTVDSHPGYVCPIQCYKGTFCYTGNRDTPEDSGNVCHFEGKPLFDIKNMNRLLEYLFGNTGNSSVERCGILTCQTFSIASQERKYSILELANMARTETRDLKIDPYTPMGSVESALALAFKTTMETFLFGQCFRELHIKVFSESDTINWGATSCSMSTGSA